MLKPRAVSSGPFDRGLPGDGVMTIHHRPVWVVEIAVSLDRKAGDGIT